MQQAMNAYGLFVAILPILPFQSLLAILLSILLRANLPIAFLVSWVSNPFTIIPIAYLNYYIGSLFIKSDTMVKSALHDIGRLFYSHNSLDRWLSSFGKAYIIGLPIVSISLALTGYLIVYTTWRLFNKKLIKKFN